MIFLKGHIYKREKTYTYVIDLGKDPITNKRQQKTKGGFKTKKEAEAALAKIQTEYNEGTYVNESNIKLKTYIDEWMELYEKSGNVKANTVRRRKHETGVIKKYFKEAEIQNITPKIYQKFLLSLLDDFADSTLRQINVVAKMIFSKALRDKVIKEDPTLDIIVPKNKKTLEDLENETEIPKYFEKNELKEFLEYAKRDKNTQAYIIFLTLAYTGMRVGELCALKWKDIDFENKTINIYKTYYNERNVTTEYELTTAKSESSRRVIAIDDDLIAALKKHRAFQSELILLNREWYKEDFVFTKVIKFQGYPETPSQIDYKMDQIIKRNNMEKRITPHGLRHTHTTLLAQAGVSLEEIQERLGHKDDKITKQIYLHITKDMKRDASQKFSELMKSI